MIPIPPRGRSVDHFGRVRASQAECTGERHILTEGVNIKFLRRCDDVRITPIATLELDVGLPGIDVAFDVDSD